MVLIYTSAQQIPCQPAAMILKFGLVLKSLCAVHLTEIIRLYELRAWVDPTNRLHGQDGCAALVEQHAKETAIIARVGIPQPIKRTEARRGQRFVDWRVVINPWITIRNRRCVL